MTDTPRQKIADLRRQLAERDAALMLILDSHLPDQPAADSGSRYEYAINHIQRLRRYAKAALDKKETAAMHKSDCALHGIDTGVKSDKYPDGISYDGPCDCGSDDAQIDVPKEPKP